MSKKSGKNDNRKIGERVEESIADTDPLRFDLIVAQRRADLLEYARTDEFYGGGAICQVLSGQGEPSASKPGPTSRSPPRPPRGRLWTPDGSPGDGARMKGSRMKVYYLSHKFSGEEKANMASALRWLAHLNGGAEFDLGDRHSYVVVAPWIANVMAIGGEGDAEERRHGLAGCCEMVIRCDGLIVIGDAPYSEGVAQELAAAVDYDVPIINYPAREWT